MLLRIKKADLLEMFFFSIVVMTAFMFWVRPYVRYLTPLILYGHLMIKEDILHIDIDFKIIHPDFYMGNHMLTYALSIVGCIIAIGIIIFIL